MADQTAKKSSVGSAYKPEIMGTRSLTKVIEVYKDKETVLTCMYRQMDGYPDGHGMELAEWLNQFTIVNGIRMNETRKIANGISCLAARMYAHFKNGPGRYYCYRPDAHDCGEEYVYEIRNTDKESINIKCIDVHENKTIFDGTPEEFINQYGLTL